MQSGLNHLSRLQIVAIDSDRLGHNPALFVGISVNVHFEPRDKDNAGQIIFPESKETGVIFSPRVVGEDHGGGSVSRPHGQRFAGSVNDHSFDATKSRYRR
jgi:hypothetical protein